MHFDIPPLQNQIFTQRAEKAFSFIQQAVNLLGKVGTSLFFRAPRYSALAESNLYQRAAKAFQFIRQVVNLLGEVGTSPFFHALRYSTLAESNLYSEGRKSVFVYPAGSESARQGWNESVFPCTSIFRPCRIKSLPEGSESVSVHPAGGESAR